MKPSDRLASIENPTALNAIIRGQDFPSSMAQKDIWSFHDLPTTDTPHGQQMVMAVNGRLDECKFNKCFDELIEQHESLRTYFRINYEGKLIQQIKNPYKMNISTTVVGDITMSQLEISQEVDRISLDQAQCDLTVGHPVRANLLQLPTEHQILILSFHPLAMDKTACYNLLASWRELDELLTKDYSAKLQKNPIQQVDYAVQEALYLNGQVSQPAVAYWQEKLANLPTILHLPYDKPWSPITPPHSAQESVSLEKDLFDALVSLGLQHGASVDIVLLAAFKLLLMRLTGQTDILIGSVGVNRNADALKSITGYFTDTTVLRNDLSGDKPFSQLLREVKIASFEAHQQYNLPYGQLNKIARVNGRSLEFPLYQCGFEYCMPPFQPHDISGGSITSVKFNTINDIPFDFMFVLTQVINEGLTGYIHYRTELFNQDTVVRFFSLFKNLLHSIIKNPEKTLSSLDILSSQEKQTILYDWNNTKKDYASNRCVHQLFEDQARNTPNAIAVKFEGQQLTYNELNQRSNQLAHYLIEQGVEPETRAGLCVERSLEMMVGLLGIIKAGGAYVPIDPKYPRQRIEYLAQDSGIKILLTQENVQQAVLKNTDIDCFCLDTDWPLIANYSTANPHCTVKPENMVYVIYTSGSTGQPKGVVVSHYSLNQLCFWHQDDFSVSEKSHATQLAGIGFDAMAWEVWPYLTCGAQISLVPPSLISAPAAFIGWLSDCHITHSFTPTPMTENLFRESWPESMALQYLLTGGDQLKRLPPAGLPFTLINNYGPTEGTVVATSGIITARGQVPPSIGRPISNARTYILDANLKPVPVSVVGELYIGGEEKLARGYLNRPKLTAERFISDPFSEKPEAKLYKTGDLVHWLPDGNIEFVGRSDYQVKIRGVRIELGEIESVLTQQAGVREALVIAYNHQQDASSDYLVAYIACDDSSSVFDQTALRSTLQTLLPDYMIPRFFILLDALPLTPNGKVDRKALPLPNTEDLLAQDYMAPATAIEAQLTAIWANVFGLPSHKLGTNSKFLALGGHSLIATRIAGEIRQTLNTKISLIDIFNNDDIRSLAQLITEEKEQQIQSIPVDSYAVPLIPIGRKQPLQLSFSQQRLWFMYELEAGMDTHYNEPLALQFTGLIDITALQKSMQTIVQRHEILRTTYKTIDGKAIQRVANNLTLEMPLIETTEELVSKYIDEHMTSVFDLEKGPLIKVCILRLETSKTLLLINMHHIVCDGWSMEVLGSELSCLYNHYKTGDSSSIDALLPSLQLQYADFSHWQRQWLQGERLEQQLNYWKVQLDGAPALLELPTDRPRPAIQSYSGARSSFDIPVALTQKLRHLSQQSGATLFMTLLAGFKILLSRYSRQDDICVATPIANRQRPELENIIGFFVNTLVLRTSVNSKAYFKDFLQTVKSTALNAYAHQDVPFDNIVEALKPERSLSYSPLFQVMFVLQDPPEATFQLTDTTVSMIDVDTHKSKFDITLIITEEGHSLSGAVEYNTDLFDEQTIQRLCGHYRVLMENITENPQKHLGDFPLLTDAEKQQILFDWNNTEVECPAGRCIYQVFEEQVTNAPQSIAAIFENQKLTYQELNQQSNQLAHYLITQGVGPEVKVGLCVERSLNMVIGILGIMKAGGAYVPIDPNNPSDRIRYILNDSQVTLVLTQLTIFDKHLSDQSDNCILLDNDWKDIAEFSPDNPDVPVKPEQLAYIIYTSGSTGMPKGTLVTHHNIARLFSSTDAQYQFNQDDIWTLFHSVAFDFSVWEIWGALAYGGKLIIVPYWISREPEHFCRLIYEQGITVLNQTPSAFNQLIAADNAIENATEKLALRYIIFGGEALDMQSLSPWFNRHGDQKPQLVNMYGITETTVHVTHYSVDKTNSQGSGSIIGKPIADLQGYIVDSQFQPVPIGVPGELYVGGGGVARGYHRQPELTNERFIADPFSKKSDARLYKTGDLVRWLPCGNIEYMGRIDHQVKIRGFRIELGEIESMLTRQAEIRDAVVVAHRHEREDKAQYLAAYIVCEDTTQEIDPAILRTALQRHLPDYMVPGFFVFLDTLPLTPNGKVDRKALPIPGEDSLLTGQFTPPRTAMEKTLAAIWAEVLSLSIEKVGIHDNFFELGGDSILSIQVVSRAHRQAISLTTRQLFEYQTIEQLAHYAKKSKHEIDQASCQGEQALLPIQHWFFDNEHAGLQHFHQSHLLHIPATFDADFLHHFMAALYKRHDALRLQFTFDNDSSWRAEYIPYETILINNSVIEEPLLGKTDQRQAHLAKYSESIKSRFDIEGGPLIKAVYFKADQPQDSRLLLVIHHLAVDGVSWRVLFDDLALAFEQWQSNSPLALPTKTSSLQQWGAKLASYSLTESLAKEKPYWLTMMSPTAPIPVDQPVAISNSWGDAETINIRLNKTDTQLLLDNCHRAYHTQINDLLLSALLLAFFRWRGLTELALTMEGHGRENLFDDIDLTGTMGWFTSLYPLRLSLPETISDETFIGELVKAVKEQYRAVPNKGIGYGVLRYLTKDDALIAAERDSNNTVVFNYLGQFDQQLGQQQAFSQAQEHTGSDVSPTLRRTDLLGFNGLVVNGRLQFELDYNHHQYHRETMIELSEFYQVALKDVIAHCQQPEVGSFTPSDFPLATLSQTDVDHWQQQYPHLADIYPATGMQEGLLFHNLLDGDAAYVVQVTWQLQGNHNISDLKQAWISVMARHSSLRTAFVGLGTEQLLQIVADQIELPWREVDWRDLSDQEQAVAFKAYRLADKARGFTIDQAPLMRCALFREADNCYRFLWTHHHSILDGWCLPIILDEVMACYKKRQADQPVSLPAASSYRHYIQWLQHQDQQAARDFWRQQLQGITAPTALGIDKLSTDPTITGPQSYQYQLTKRLTSEIQQVTRRYGITLNTLVQAAWAYVLHRYSGDDKVVFGETVSGRPADLLHADQMVGLFINTQPACISINDKTEINIWLKQLHQLQAQRVSYSHLPLVEIEACSEISGGSNLFNTLLVFENYPTGEALNNTAESSASSLLNNLEAYDETHYDISLTIYPHEPLSFKVMYNANVYALETIKRTIQHITQVLTGFTNNTITCIGDLPLLTEAERKQLLVDWNNTGKNYSNEQSVHKLFEEQVKKTPNSVAIVHNNQQLTYTQLNERSNQLANYFIQRGVTLNSRIGISVERSLGLAIGILGILKAGAAYVPLDPGYPKDRLSYMLDHANISILLTQKSLLDKFSKNVDVVILDDDPEWKKQKKHNSQSIAGFNPESLAYVIFTSGSTGLPKAVAMPHSALTNLIYWQVEQSAGDTGTNTLQFSAFSFDVSFQELFSTWCSGGTLVLINEDQRKDPFALWHIIDQQKINRLFMPFIALQQLAEVYKEIADELIGEKKSGHTLQEIFTAGEQLQITPAIRSLFQQLTQCKLYNHYGPSETHVCTSLALEGSSDTWEALPTIGHPIANNSIYILDSSLQPVPIGIFGELYVGGIGLARGYLNRNDLTAERFIENPLRSEITINNSRLYKTGDLARYRADGAIEYQGRVDNQVKIRGYRIEPGEIENVLAGLPDVQEAIIAVHSRNQAPQDKYLAAYIISKENINFEPEKKKEKLRRAIQKILPEYMIPAVFMLLEELPLTPSGKVDRKSLPVPDEKALATKKYLAPRTETEKNLLDIWSTVLSLSPDDIGIQDDFFDLGGHSLLATRVVSQIRKVFSIGIQIRDLFILTTIDKLAEKIDQKNYQRRLIKGVMESTEVSSAQDKDKVRI